MATTDLFLSYSRGEEKAVANLRRLLKARGISTFFDRRDLKPGLPWAPALEEALQAAKAVAVVVGRQGLGAWQKREVYFALDRQARIENEGRSFPVVPLLLEGADPDISFLFLNTWVDLRRDPRDPEGLDSLVRTLRGSAPSKSIVGPAASSPYRGLRAFHEENAPFFFGREEFTRRLLDSVLHRSLVAVVGPSGSGKSSVVMAGLLPLLRRERPPRASWDVALFHPGNRPFHLMARALIPLVDPQLVRPMDQLDEASKLAERLRTGRLGLADVVGLALENAGGSERLILVADQFEEVFTQSPEPERRPLVAALLDGVEKSALHVVLTLRGDFYGHALALDRRLSDAMERGQVNIGPMSGAELRRAIEEPARLMGVRLQSGLANRILSEVETQKSHPGDPAVEPHGAQGRSFDPKNLPLLEFALTELWAADREDGELGHAAYDAIGGVSGAIAERAESELEKLGEDQQERVRRLFTRLVRVARPGEGAQDTRRRAAWEELDQGTHEVIERLAAPDVRLLALDRDNATGRQTVEITHEALIQGWDRLQAWLDDDREFLLWRQRLRAALAEHLRSGTLLAEAPLTEAARWLRTRRRSLSDDEILLIDRSAAHREGAVQKANRRKRRLLLSGVTALLLMAVLGSVSVWFGLSSRRQAARARATSILVSAASQDSVTRAALLAVESRRIAPGHMTTLSALSFAHRTAVSQVPVTLLQGHEALVRTAVFCPKGARVLTASEDGTARIWKADGSGDSIVLRGHEDEVRTAVFSPDGEVVLTSSSDGTARIWNSDGSGAPLVLRGHWDRVGTAVFSPDGSRVVTASADNSARVWNTDGSGEPLVIHPYRDVAPGTGTRFFMNNIIGIGSPLEVPGSTSEEVSRNHIDNALELAQFSPSGDRIMTLSRGGTIRVWSADGSGDPVVIREDQARVRTASFSPDGRRIASGGGDGVVRLWSADGAGQPLVFSGHDGWVLSIAFSPDGSQFVAAATANKTARILSVDGSKPAVLLRGHEDGVWRAVFSPAGDRVATISANGTARVWKADGTGGPTVLLGHRRAVYAVSFSPEGSRVVTASSDGTTRVWDLSRPPEPLVLRGHGKPLRGASFSPDGARVVTASDDGTARVWPVGGSGEPIVLRGHSARVSSAVFSPRGDRIVTTSQDRTARIWSADGKRQLVVLRGHEGPVESAAFSPRGDLLVTASRDATARVWHAGRSGSSIVLRGHQKAVTSAAFSPDGRRVVTASRDRTARIWRADGSGEPVILRGHERGLSGAMFSPAGDQIVTASEDKTARVWKADGSGGPVVLRGHQGRVFSARFNSSGDRVVTASDDNTARVWRADGSGSPIILRGHQDWVLDAVFSPSGDHVVTASNDDTARIWQANGTAEALVLRGHKRVVSSAVFGPFGDRVVTVSNDRTARVWRMSWSALVDYLDTAVSGCLDTQERMQFLGESSSVARRRYDACKAEGQP